MKIYSDWLHRQMDNLGSIFVVFGDKTETAFKQEEKFSFSLGSVIGFPAAFLMTFLASFGSRHIRLLLFTPIQLSLVLFVLPCSIIYNNTKIKRRALNLAESILETLSSYSTRLQKLSSSKVAPKATLVQSDLNKDKKICFWFINWRPSHGPETEGLYGPYMVLT